MIITKQSHARSMPVATIGFYGALLAFIAAVGYSIAQILQVVGFVAYPLDAILIFAFSLGIALPWMLSILALHYTIPDEKKIWTHAALLFSLVYVTYVTLNYVVQLGTVIPMTGTADQIRILVQSPHSLFWDLDALGYIFLGLATLFASAAFAKQGLQRWLRWFFLANGLLTPIIAFIYFYPYFSYAVLLTGLPWIITAPGSMFLLALFFRIAQTDLS
jgi:hypothetical protein